MTKSKDQVYETESLEARFKTALKNGQLFVFFDGTCMLCNNFVAWVVSNDPEGAVLFAPLQGKTAQFALESSERDALSSVIVISSEGKFTESEAVAEVLSHLPGWQVWSGPLKLVPLKVRDFAYKVVARNRKRWFGESEECPMPLSEHKDRLWP